MSETESFSVHLSVSPSEMSALWERARRDAISQPGTTIVLRLAPGEYPLPDYGEYEYRAVPTTMTVSKPGVEVRFNYNRRTNRTTITTAPMAFEGENA